MNIRKTSAAVVLLDATGHHVTDAGLVDIECLNDDLYSFRVELAANDSKGPPTEIRMFKQGITETTKGRFLFDAMSAEKVMARFREKGHDRLPFDYGHGMVSFGGDQRAAAWFVPEVRNGELWATDIQWTPNALTALAAREWRFYSPAFRALWPDDPNEPAVIREIINCALTNLPATYDQKPIINSSVDVEAKGNQGMKGILTRLGVSEESAAETRVGQLINAETENTTLTALAAQRGFKSVAEMASAFDANQKETDALKKEARKSRVAQLSADGRLPPAQHDYACSLSDEQFEAFVKTLPAGSLAPNAGTPTALSARPSGGAQDGGARVPTAAEVTLTAEELELSKSFGQDPEQMKKVKSELLSGEHPFRYVPRQTTPTTTL